MNKTAIKNFAIWARNKLIADIVYKAGLLGITEKGIANALPQSTREVQFFDIGTKDYMIVRGNAIRQRDAFVAAIKAKQADTDYVSSFRFVVEKVAYTWFNRLIAIRFMEVNDYLPSRVRVLSSENPGKAEPDMVTRPFDTDMSFTAQERNEIMRMKDENKLDELFRMFFIKQCQKLSEVLPGLFSQQGIDRTDSYQELLLTISFTDKDGVLWHLINDIKEKDFRIRTPEDDERQQEKNIPEEDMPAGQVEIIGWMYQYYNTEPKDQVFANLKKNIKINKDSIPAATQLFTPDWIVRYMVENSLGRLWVDGHPNEELKKNWKYYLEEAEQEQMVQERLSAIRNKYAALHPEELKIIDPCMGSGHILVYLFDVLMQIYESQGWTQREAAQSIVKNNLFGLDIDDRAAQLAYFAIMMKARQYDRRFLERGIIPHVHSIHESNGINRDQIKLFGKGMTALEKNNALNQLFEILEKYQDAMEYGSILKISSYDWDLLYRYAFAVEETGQIGIASIGAEETLAEINNMIRQAQIMSQRYDVVITNPPYMGSSGMGPKLSQYIKTHYPDSKGDLFAVFIERCGAMLNEYGLQAMITMQSWMFLSSFEELRKKILSHQIVNLLKIGFNSFPELNSQVAHACTFVISNHLLPTYSTVYFDLNTGKVTDNKERVFLLKKEAADYFVRKNKDFYDIPGTPLAFSFSHEFLKDFEEKKISNYAEVITGMTTGNNTLYLRLWTEIDRTKAAIGATSFSDINIEKTYWIPYSKGGERRNWYGNTDYLVNWSRKNEFNRSKTTLQHLYLRRALTWPFINTDTFSARLLPAGYLWDVAGSPCFFDNRQLESYCLGFLCSKVAAAMLRVINPTINVQAIDIEKLPLKIDQTIYDNVIALVEENLSISTKEWNSYEMSWGFDKHPLLIGDSVEEAFNKWAELCDYWFERVKDNEETINKLFIMTYNVADDLQPEVEDRRITIRKADKNRDIRSLISYAVGCMFGRYSLETPGLVYAGGDWRPRNNERFQPDPDNCIPITDEAYFDDDIVGRFISFIRIAYGEEKLEENLDFIAKAIGVKGDSSREILRSYFLNDFFNDHCSTYSVAGSGKRPIYWLFDSGKQNGFKALVYMHRWDANTVGNLRVEYLHRMQRVYEKEIDRMQDIMENSKDNREINQASKRREKLVKQQKEARDYDAKIAHIALSRVEIDLDDGVKVNYEKVQKGPDGKSLGILAKIYRWCL